MSTDEELCTINVQIWVRKELKKIAINKEKLLKDLVHEILTNYLNKEKAKQLCANPPKNQPET